MEKYIVKQEARPQSPKDYLRKTLGLSNNLWKKIKLQGQFYVNGQQVIPTRVTLQPGDEIAFTYPVNSTVIPVEMDLDIVFEDAYFLILNKPAHQLTHPLSHEPDTSLANGVVHYFQKHKLNIGCHPLYRLDRNTSGLVIFAKLPQLQAWLGGNHTKLKRYYYALVRGIMPQKEGVINAPLGSKEGSIILQTVRPEGKEAITYYQVIKEFDNYSLVKIHLATGRTHQIRAHFAYLHHPLLGDDLYGGTLDLIRRQALHAGELSFVHPYTGASINLTTPLPADMAQLIK